MTAIKEKGNTAKSNSLFGVENTLANSITHLTLALVDAIKENNGQLDLDKAAAILDTSNNRLNDVVSVLEAVGYLKSIQNMTAMNITLEMDTATSSDCNDDLNKCDNSVTGFNEFESTTGSVYNLENISVIEENPLTNTTCGVIDTSNDSGIYNIHCIFCAETFNLQNWMVFVNHLKGRHYSRDDQLVGVNNIVIENQDYSNKARDTENITSLGKHIVEKNADDIGETFESESEDSYESHTEEHFNNGEIENHNEVGSQIAFRETDAVVVLNFLELLKEFPILWQRRKKLTEAYSEALITITNQFNERYKFNYTAKGIRCSIKFIRKWYYHVLHMRNKAEINYKGRYVEYFQKCDEFLPKYYSCNICKANCSTEEQLQRHVDAHSADGKFICNLCGKKSSTKAIHKLHVKRHGEPQYRCSICNKGFHTTFQYKEHMKVHRNERDYVCEQCGKSFVRQKTFMLHKQSAHLHKFVCAICNKKYACPTALQKHRRNFHIVSEGTIEELATMSTLRRTKHIYVFDHKTNAKRIKCKLCDKTYVNHDGLRSHMMTKHCDDIVQQEQKKQQHCKTTLEDKKSELTDNS